MLADVKVAVLGASGQLGTDLVRALDVRGADVVAPDHSQLDVTDRQQVADVIEAARPAAVVNCAAFHRVDDCEDRPDVALAVNTRGAFEVARACAAVGAVCVYASSDYVFSGGDRGPHDETARPAPINFYGVSKYSGELCVAAAAPEWMVVRIASLFGRAGARGKGGNFIETILQRGRDGQPLSVVADQFMSPTYAADAAATIADLLAADARGTFHVTNSGRCSWHELATAAVEAVGLDVEVAQTTASSYPSRARRPADSSLTSVRLEDAVGYSPRPWREALNAYLVEKAHVE